MERGRGAPATQWIEWPGPDAGGAESLPPTAAEQRRELARLALSFVHGTRGLACTVLSCAHLIGDDLRLRADPRCRPRVASLRQLAGEVERHRWWMVAYAQANARLAAGETDAPLPFEEDVRRALTARLGSRASLVEVAPEVPQHLPVAFFRTLPELIGATLPTGTAGDRRPRAPSAVVGCVPAGGAARGSWHLFIRHEGLRASAEAPDEAFRPFPGVRAGGLRLVAARALVSAHGGRCWLEAGPGGQGTFHFTWPRYAAAVERAERAEETAFAVA